MQVHLQDSVAVGYKIGSGVFLARLHTKGHQHRTYNVSPNSRTFILSASVEMTRPSIVRDLLMLRDTSMGTSQHCSSQQQTAIPLRFTQSIADLASLCRSLRACKVNHTSISTAGRTHTTGENIGPPARSTREILDVLSIAVALDRFNVV